MKQVVLALAVILSVAAFAYSAGPQDPEKDWCLLGVVDKCPATTTLDIVDKIKRLEFALNKGAAVYTPAELKHLRAMLDEAYETRDQINRKN